MPAYIHLKSVFTSSRDSIYDTFIIIKYKHIFY